MMNTLQERLYRLDHALQNKENICSSEGMLHTFPASLKRPFLINGAGLVICRRGSFMFSLNQKTTPPKPERLFSYRKTQSFKSCRSQTR